MLYDKRWEQKPKPKAGQQILLDAADLIERQGWCQGAWQHNGSHCALGAMFEVRGRRGAQRAESRMFAAVGPIIDWNDHPDRTAAEVVAKLREVATRNNR